MKLILASASPRRRELLRRAGFDFDVRPASVEEVRGPGETAEDFSRRVACEKALKVAESAPTGSVVIGADTVVVVNDEILGKPADPGDAARMLRLLSGITHRVLTAVSIVRAPHHSEALEHEATFVTFRKLDEQEIEEYISSGEPFDKAGAYGIQGLASKFVRRIEGDYFNVVGLPVPLVYELLKPLLIGAK
jgi:septum formation protein